MIAYLITRRSSVGMNMDRTLLIIGLFKVTFTMRPSISILYFQIHRQKRWFRSYRIWHIHLSYFDWSRGALCQQSTPSVRPALPHNQLAQAWAPQNASSIQGIWTPSCNSVCRKGTYAGRKHTCTIEGNCEFWIGKTPRTSNHACVPFVEKLHAQIPWRIECCSISSEVLLGFAQSWTSRFDPSDRRLGWCWRRWSWDATVGPCSPSRGRWDSRPSASAWMRAGGRTRSCPFPTSL